MAEYAGLVGSISVGTDGVVVTLTDVHGQEPNAVTLYRDVGRAIPQSEGMRRGAMLALAQRAYTNRDTLVISTDNDGAASTVTITSLVKYVIDQGPAGPGVDQPGDIFAPGGPG